VFSTAGSSCIFGHFEVSYDDADDDDNDNDNTQKPVLVITLTQTELAVYFVREHF